MRYDIIVIGASAGGVEVVSRLISYLPKESPAAVFVTLHLSPFSESVLPRILERAGNLEARHPKDQERVRGGTIFVAPPDFHLLLEDGQIRLDHGPKENRHRPSIDVLFRSASRAYGDRVAGILLTGNLDDGVAGLIDIKRHGGLTIVQDPKEAPFPEMPIRALAAMKIDWCLSLKDIGKKLQEVMGVDMGRKKTEGAVSSQTLTSEPNEEKQETGTPIPLVCPDCQGPLTEFRNGELTNYRCLVGHRYSLESLLAAHREETEQALWVALRCLEERIALQQRLAESARSRKNVIAASDFAAKASKNTEHARLLRKMLQELLPE